MTTKLIIFIFISLLIFIINFLWYYITIPSSTLFPEKDESKPKITYALYSYLIPTLPLFLLYSYIINNMFNLI